MRKTLWTALTLSLFLMANSSETRASEPMPSPVASMTAPIYHSGLSETGTFTISVQFPGTTPLAPNALAPFVELWDFNTQTKSDFTLATSAATMGAYDLTPTSPLLALHEYGIRLDPSSKISTRYSGLFGEFGAVGQNGELGRYVIGSQPRVWEIMLKGGRSLYLSFSEPVLSNLVAFAVTLTNTTTGASIKGTMSPPPVMSGSEFVIELDGTKLDATAPHVLRISKSVTTMDGVPLDGAFAGDGVAADFEYELTPAQVDVFVNGYPREETLEIRCNNNMIWYNPQTSRPAVGPAQCVQVSPQSGVGTENEEAVGCSLTRGTRSTTHAAWLVALAGLGICRRFKRGVRATD